jgi:hypothetical protein
MLGSATNNSPLRAAFMAAIVSGFGFSGSNAKAFSAATRTGELSGIRLLLN